MSNGGKALVAQTMMPFSAGAEWNYYLKKLERFVEKCDENPNYVCDEDYDHVSCEKNTELYDLYIKKYQFSIYSKRINKPIQTLLEGKNKFSNLDIKEQSKVLLNIHMTFGRISGGSNLEMIGGKKKAAATVGLNSCISNWGKNYKNVRIIDQSSSGLWEKKSCNLLTLL